MEVIIEGISIPVFNIQISRKNNLYSIQLLLTDTTHTVEELTEYFTSIFKGSIIINNKTYDNLYFDEIIRDYGDYTIYNTIFFKSNE